MASRREDYDLKLRVKFVDGNVEKWSRMVISWEILGLSELTSLQKETVLKITENIWKNEVEIQELEQVIYELFPDRCEKKMRKTLQRQNFIRIRSL